MTEPIGTTNIGDLRMTEQIAERHFGQGCNMGGTDGLKLMAEPVKTHGNCGWFWKHHRETGRIGGGCGWKPTAIPPVFSCFAMQGAYELSEYGDASACECWKERE